MLLSLVTRVHTDPICGAFAVARTFRGPPPLSPHAASPKGLNPACGPGRRCPLISEVILHRLRRPLGALLSHSMILIFVRH